MPQPLALPCPAVWTLYAPAQDRAQLLALAGKAHTDAMLGEMYRDSQYPTGCQQGRLLALHTVCGWVGCVPASPRRQPVASQVHQMLQVHYFALDAMPALTMCAWSCPVAGHVAALPPDAPAARAAAAQEAARAGQGLDRPPTSACLPASHPITTKGALLAAQAYMHCLPSDLRALPPCWRTSLRTARLVCR